MAATNTQFSVGVHILTALAYHDDQVVVSQGLTESVNADPTYVRKVLSKLSKAGLVTTTRGKNGHCKLARPASKISLLDIYRATEAPQVFAVHTYRVQKACVISASHQGIMDDVLAEIQTAFERSLQKKHLSDLVGKVKRS